MNVRWLVVTLLLHSAVAALAQPEKDPQNLPPITPDPVAAPRDAVPPSKVNAETAAVSPATSKPVVSQKPCDPDNPCAMPTPAAR